MYRTQSEKQEYIKKLFFDVELFEWEVLHVSTNEDRIEIMQILAKTLVRETLKEEINFVSIHNYTSFKISSIKSALFEEIANEWIYFAREILYYSKENALKEIKNKQRVNFLYKIINIYYKKYRKYIFKEIADTFIELVGNIQINKNIEDSKILIDKVLQSDLISDGNNLAMHTSNQLKNKISTAYNEKKAQILQMRERISELELKLKNRTLEPQEYYKLNNSLENYKLSIENYNKKDLGEFDLSIERLKDTFIKSMLNKTK